MIAERPDYPTIARMAKEFMKRVDLKGEEVEAYMIVTSTLTGIIIGELVVSEGSPETPPEINPETPEKSPEGR